MSQFVSIIIPCRNEERFIGPCLDSVLAQDYPPDRIEVLIADGMSVDNTRKILEEYAAKDARVRWFENPPKIVSTGLNILLRHIRGEMVILMGVHAEYDKNFISCSAKYLREFSADAVGGVCRTFPGSATMMAKAIAIALASSFGVGGSRFRVGVKEPAWVETVVFGCYRRDVFDRVGSFNENLVRNQDNEFNARIIKTGGKILLHPDIKCSYHARADLSSIARQHFLNGFWCVYGVKFSKNTFFPRHLVPLAFVLSLTVSFLAGIVFKPFLWLGLGIAGLYFAAMLVASLVLALKHGIRYFPLFLTVFPALHIPYGIGSICGLVKLLIPENK